MLRLSTDTRHAFPSTNTLEEAHEAFVFGAPLAALALMRSIVETMLRDHYGAQGSDLNELIRVCSNLPEGANPAALRVRRLANAVLHFDQSSLDFPRDDRGLENAVVGLLFAVRALIEGAPLWRDGSRRGGLKKSRWAKYVGAPRDSA